MYCATPVSSANLTAMYRASFGVVLKICMNQKYLNCPVGSSCLVTLDLECYSSNLTYLGIEEGTGWGYSSVGEITQDELMVDRIELYQYATTYYVRPKLTFTRDGGTGTCTVRADNVYVMRDLKAGMLRTTYHGKDTSLGTGATDRVQLLDLTGQVNLSDLRAYNAEKQQYLYQHACAGNRHDHDQDADDPDL